MNTKKYLITLASAIITVAFFAILINTAQASTFCADGNTLTYAEAFSAYNSRSIQISMTKTDSSHVQIAVNNETDCALPTVVGSYRVYDNITSATQKPIDARSALTISAGTSHTFTLNVDSCLSQVDIWQSMNFSDLFIGHIYGPDGRVFDSVPSAEGLFCTDTTPSTFVASCSASPSSIKIGGTINWSGTATGGTGTYTYSWTGTDSLSGTSSAISKSYSSVGTKNATITVTSGRDVATADCSASVTRDGIPPTPPPGVCVSNCGGGGGPIIPLDTTLSGYCSANPSTGKVGDPIIWSAYPSGGNGSYYYNWFGSDMYSNSGQSFGKIYSTPGTKNMTVRITSGSETITRNCSADLGHVLAYTSLSSVYLSEVPYTGIGDLNNIWVFTIGLALWSALLAFYLQRRKGKMVTEVVSAGIQKQNIEEKSSLISRNEMSEMAISEVENCARNGKAIISTDAVKGIVKNCFLHNGRADVAVMEVISKARKSQNIAEGDWIAIGEKDLQI